MKKNKKPKIPKEVLTERHLYKRRKKKEQQKLDKLDEKSKWEETPTSTRGRG